MISRSIKVGLATSKKVCVICFIENPFKMMKMAFYFMLKAIFVLKIFHFMSFWSCRRNGLIKQIRLISKFMTCNLVSKQLQQAYCPISHEVKATRSMKLGQLTENNKTNIFLQKLYRKCARETSSRPLFIFKKAYYKVKASGLQLIFNIF